MAKRPTKTYRSLAPEELRFHCPEGEFPWPDTRSIPGLRGLVGQERALASIDFGLNMPGRGYNLFLLGEPGCGKSTTMLAMMEAKAEKEPVPSDWCYVYNFRDPRRPLALPFPPGQGKAFAQRMKDFSASLRKLVGAALEDKELERRRAALVEQMRKENGARLEAFTAGARDEQFSLEKVGDEWAFIPTRNGLNLSEEAFNELPLEERGAYETRLRALRENFKELLLEIHHREEKAHQEVEELNREQVRGAVHPPLERVGEIHDGGEKLRDWLGQLEEDLGENYSEFFESPVERTLFPGIKMMVKEPTVSRYEVNLFIDQTGKTGAPVVTERNPTFYNLLGKMEYTIQFGMASTNYLQLRPGALHRANGGYLLLDALEVLRSPFAWETIKNALKGGSIQIEDLGEQYRVISSSTLRPEPIPLSAKVVLTGTPDIYYLLRYYDEDMDRLFKVKADFGTSMPRSPEAIREYASFVASVCQKEGLLPFQPSGLARAVEHGCRLADDKGRLTTRFSAIADLVRESSYWASKEGAPFIGREHVVRAEKEKTYRGNRVEERMGDLIEEGTLYVDTSGKVVGQVNGLSVYDLGDHAFAKPTRITAKVTPGKSGMVQIDREVKLSGVIHSKGVMIVSSYLAERYALDFPLSLSASVTFEQTYEEVEGDSASAAELIALVSAVAQVPIAQGLAITGSLDQHGRIQPVGGVNEKVEGYFRTCLRRGLTGTQGVVLPAANVRNLMLSEEVVEAVREGKFGVFAIETVDQGIEILTGMPAGERGKKGDFPRGTFNELVEANLKEMADILRAYDEPDHPEGPEHEEDEEEKKPPEPKKKRKKKG